MSLSVLLLLLQVCSVQAAFYGIVMNYYPNSNGFSKGIVRYKLSDSSCTFYEPVTIGGEGIVLNKVDEESNGGPCQTEGKLTQYFSSNSIFEIPVSGLDWISGIKNGIVSFTADIVVDLSIRSDIGHANTSPQTTIMPAVRVPSNCARNLKLLSFDPDGDVVRCRNGDASLSECSPCTPPSVLSLSPSTCTLSFSPTNSSNEGLYAVQLMMEDFPRENITLTQSVGTQTTITTNDAIGKLPVQFVFIVDPAVPSCTEGLFLPRFLPPTPANGNQLYTNVSQTLQINITAEALNSTISELLFSGPYTVTKGQTGPGQFTLTWTPSDIEAGQSHPICFVVQAILGANKYQSELRCVVVSVGNALNTISTTTLPDTSPTTVPDTLPTTLPDTLPTTLPDTLPTTQPDTSPTTVPDTLPTTLPDTLPTTLPDTLPTTVPDTLPTTLPDTLPTTVPDTLPTTLPDTLPTTQPDTLPTTQPTTSPATTAAISPIPAPTSTTHPPINTSQSLNTTTTTTVPKTSAFTLPNISPIPLPISTTPPPEYVAALKVKLTSLVNLNQIDEFAALNQIKQLVKSFKLPNDITVRIRSTNPPLDMTIPLAYLTGSK